MNASVTFHFQITDADDFVPEDANKSNQVVSDKWDGEDEEEVSVKESRSPKGESSESSDNIRAVQRKKKKKLADVLAEKEAARVASLEARAAEEAAKKMMNTPEAKMKEKMRIQKEEANTNLMLAKDIMS